MNTLGVTQADLVGKTGLNKTTMSHLVNAQQDYGPEIIRDIAAALNIAPYELLMDPEDAMNLRQLRQDAMRVVETSKRLDEREDKVRTGTGG